MRYFVYGTLLDPELRNQVLGRGGRRLPTQMAWLDGYCRVQMGGTPYPTLRRQPGRTVRGLLLSGIDARLAERLARYEGTDYRRHRCTVRVAGGTRAAWIFLTAAHRATKLGWERAGLTS